MYFDGDGYAWFIDPELAVIYAISGGNLWYEASDCSGTEYITAPRTMEPFEFFDDTGTFYVRPFDLASVEIQGRGWRQSPSSSCLSSTASTRRVVLFADTVPATPIVQPTSAWVGPLHREP